MLNKVCKIILIILGSVLFITLSGYGVVSAFYMESFLPGTHVNGRDITGELADAVDKVNVSLNAGDRDTYYDICRPVFGEDAFDAIKDFAVKCKGKGIITEFSIVDILSSEQTEKCKKIAKELNISLRIRKYIQDS